MNPVLPAVEKSRTLQPGARVGPYRLIEEIGKGGMGRVFLAERVDGEYEQRVALKLINRGEDEEELLPRFYQERQALAMLAHPNIARLLGGGVTDDGQPYLVMEYIEGVPLDVYCDRQQCDTLTRVRLFREVLAGVQHAHQHFLVHRDLKPGNILVTAEGVPKLLDFGIVKWLQVSNRAPKLTVTGAQPMTLEYASPEQVKGDAITTVSDVYSLGVLLYELLTGHSPYRKSTNKSYDLQKAICEEEPEAPSAAVNRTEPASAAEQQPAKTLTPETVSATREGSPQKLRRRLAGDLDSIVLKALRKEPQHRYSSAEQFSEDLQRYLEGRPVSAREGEFSYRAEKFIKRNAGKLSVAAAFVVLIVGFAINTKVQANRIAKERDTAVAAGNFLVSIFTPVDPVEAPSDSITVRTLLDSGAARIKTDLANQPELQAAILFQFGDINRKLGKFDLADSLLRESLARRREIHDDQHPEIAKALVNLGRLYYHTGKFPQAESLLVEALEIYRTKFGEKSSEFAYTLTTLGQLHTATSQLEKSATELSNARDLMLQLQPQGSYELGELLLNLSNLNLSQGDFESAKSNGQLAYDMLLKYSSERNPELAGALTNWAVALIQQGKYDEAEPLLRKAYNISAAAVTENHPVTAFVKGTLGNCLTKLHRYEEAEHLLTSACQLLSASAGVNHPYTQRAITNIVELYEAWSKPQQAEEYRRLLLEWKNVSQ